MRLGEIYRSRIISLLTPIVGAGNLKAEVNVDMNFTKREITEDLLILRVTLKVNKRL